MSLDPEDDLLAAEFALGTLDPGERAALAARRQREPELDAAIAAWERRLAPLAEAAPPVAPPSDRFCRHRGAHSCAPDRATRRRAGRRGIERSRRSRLRARALARGGDRGFAASRRSSLAGVVGARSDATNAPHEFVAVLQKSPDAPAFAVTVNIDTREFTVRPVAAPAPAGKSYELWIIDAKLGAPRSLGVIDAARSHPRQPARGLYAPRRRRRRDLRRHRRAAGRLADRRALGAAGIRRQAHPGRTVSDDAALPVHIVTGFLGAGKTTFINRLLAGSRARRTRSSSSTNSARSASIIGSMKKSPTTSC